MAPRDHQVERRVARLGRARLEDQVGAAAELDDSNVRRGVDRPHPEGDVVVEGGNRVSHRHAYMTDPDSGPFIVHVA